MPIFRYEATQADGQRDSGEVTAADADDARRQLMARGFLAIHVVEPVAEESAGVTPLSTREAEEVVATLAELSNAELPLAEGLRAAAAESVNRRVARALRDIAADVERGFSLESCVTQRGESLPPHVRGLIAAATRSRRLGLTLDELVEHYRVLRETRAQVIASLAYPVLVFSLALVLVSFVPLAIMPTFRKMFEEFELELPAATKFVIQLSDVLRWFISPPGIWVLLVAAGAFLTFVVATTLGRSTAIAQRFAATVPLLGPMWQWSGAAAFARLMATMLDNQIPLSEALRLAAAGVPDPDIRDTALLLSGQVAEGRSLSDAIGEGRRLPLSIVPLVRWGERTNALPEAFRTCSEMLLSRVRLRALLLRSVSPPLVFLVVGLVIGFFVLALYMPMVSLIQGLS